MYCRYCLLSITKLKFRNVKFHDAMLRFIPTTLANVPGHDYLLVDVSFVT